MTPPQTNPPAPVAPTVLVVDDDQPLLEMASHILRGAGFDVVTAGNGLEALEQARSVERIDLVFTDIFMPGVNGLELGEALGRERPELPFLFTTGQATDDVQAAVRATGHPLLLKPYTAPALREAALAACRGTDESNDGRDDSEGTA